MLNNTEILIYFSSLAIILLTSFTALFFFNDLKTRRFLSCVASGYLVSFMCFEMLPGGFKSGGFSLGIAALIIGVTFGILMTERSLLIQKYKRTKRTKNKVKSINLYVYSFVGSVAIGAYFSSYSLNAVLLILILSIKMTLDTNNFYFMFKYNDNNKKHLINSLFLKTFLLAVVVNLGFLAGSFISNNVFFSAFLICFFGGIMLYIACNDIFPDSNTFLQEKLSAAGGMIGFLVGIFLSL